MKYNYDFDKIIDRTGTSCAKWDSTEQIFGEKDLLPMWVADMDFQSPPAIVDALVKRAQHGFFGYSVIDPGLQGSRPVAGSSADTTGTFSPSG
jgi:cystathionine beta-lyase